MDDVNTNAMKMSLSQAGRRYLSNFGQWEFHPGKKTLLLTMYCKQKRRCRELRETQEDRTHFNIISVKMESRLDFFLKALDVSEKFFRWVGNQAIRELQISSESNRGHHKPSNKISEENKNKNSEAHKVIPNN